MKVSNHTFRTDVIAAGTEFEVVYYASKGFAGTYWEPPEPAELLVEQVFIGKQEVTDLLAEWVNEAIYEELDKSLTEESRKAEEDKAEAEYNAWKESRNEQY